MLLQPSGCVPFSFVNRSWLLWSLCQRRANAPQAPCKRRRTPWSCHGIAVITAATLWGRNGINDIRFRRTANAVDALLRRGRDTVTFPYTPWGLRANATAYSGVLAGIICVPAACARRPRGAPGDLTALLLHCRCKPTAWSRRWFRSPWERRPISRTLCMHKVRTVAWRPRKPHGLQWRCHGDAMAIPRHSRRCHCATSAFWVFLACRAVAVRTPPWCDRGLSDTGVYRTNEANLRDWIAATGLVILLKLGSNLRFFSPCDLEIWWMTWKNYRAPLLHYIKLCASSQTPWWIKTGVIVRKIGSNRRFFVPCHLQIWWMTLKNNRAPLICRLKLCASFHSHQWIKTKVTVWKHSIRIKIGNLLSRVTFIFNRWPRKTIEHFLYVASSFTHHFVAIGEFKLELQSGNA